jgi:hypothetical protein
LAELSILAEWRRRDFPTAVSRYADQGRIPVEPGPRIYLEVIPGDLEGTVLAMVDTAAPWCIFEPRIGKAVQDDLPPIVAGIFLSTRLGVFRGSLYRVPVRFPVLEGEPVSTEATVFVSPDWTGPNFIGYQGLLQRIRFAVDPEANLFYFGRI